MMQQTGARRFTAAWQVLLLLAMQGQIVAMHYIAMPCASQHTHLPHTHLLRNMHQTGQSYRTASSIQVSQRPDSHKLQPDLVQNLIECTRKVDTLLIC